MDAMGTSTKICFIALTSLQFLLLSHKIAVVHGQSDEQLMSCSISKDDISHEDGSCYSEVDAAITLGNETHFDSALRHILIKRVVGTVGHSQVAEYLKSSLNDLGWHVTSDAFEAQTPRGRKKFENIIAQLNPGASRAIALSCHYDSKHFDEFDFLAATDSAVPCAMMVNLAYTLQRQLQRLKQADTSLDLIFFDGEEALLEWTHDDSLYGSRHLAAKMERENTLQRLKLLVLLDLLGAEFPVFQSHFASTDNEHRMLLEMEKKLRASRRNRGRTLFFQGRPVRYFQDIPRRGVFGRTDHITIEDDHVPFFRKGVPILHIIPTPFPSVWHQQGDNEEALDMPTIYDLNVILRAFILRYFSL